MRQPQRKQVGAAGETGVKHFFELIDWGPLSTGDHDLGTDLFVQIRDDNLVDLRMMIGVQVKTGPSWFDEPGVVDGQAGWWFREADKKHAEYWTNHHLPHIIVLQTSDETTRVWNFLNSLTIEDTGQGFKVFIPANQVLNRKNAERWTNAASEARRLIAFEGSRWNFSVEELLSDDWARYALLTPRLVAPHSNKGFSRPIVWAEAVAICVEAEPERWDYFAQQQETVPSWEEAAKSKVWGWRFAAAVYQWVSGGEVGALEALVVSGEPASSRIARAICLSVALFDRDRFDEALAVLDAEAEADEYTTDQGWLNVHRARILIETGHHDSAVDLVKRANVQLASVHQDVTVSAIRSAAVWALYEVTDRFDQDLSSVVPALDTTAGWWRTQTTASGLESAAKGYFKTWARDRSITFGATNTAHNHLFSSALVARLTGAHGNWRSATTLLATIDLSSERPQALRPLDSLDSLRRVGDDANLSLAIARIRQEGPLDDIVELVAAVRPEAMTRTSSKADLILLRDAGDYCTEGNANRLLDFLLDVLHDPGRFHDGYSPQYILAPRIIDAIGGLSHHMSALHEDRLIRYVVSLGDSPDQLTEGPLHGIRRQLSPTALRRNGPDLVNRAVLLPDKNWYYWLLLAMAGPGDRRSRQNFREGLLDGNLDALVAVGTFENLEVDEAEAILETCKEGLDGYHQDGVRGSFTGYVHDYGRLIVQIALQFPDLEAWTALIDFLGDEVIHAGRKRSSCKMLAETAAILSSDTRQSLLTVVTELLSQAVPDQSRFAGFFTDIGGAFDELYLELIGPDGSDRTEVLARMLAGDQDARFDAADYLSRHAGQEMVLLAMTREANYRVGKRSMLCLARRVSDAVDLDPVYRQALANMLEADGEANSSHILGGLQAHRPSPTHVSALVGKLQTHPSADIRHRATELTESNERN